MDNMDFIMCSKAVNGEQGNDIFENYREVLIYNIEMATDSFKNMIVPSTYEKTDKEFRTGACSLLKRIKECVENHKNINVNNSKSQLKEIKTEKEKIVNKLKSFSEENHKLTEKIKYERKAEILEKLYSACVNFVEFEGILSSDEERLHIMTKEVVNENIRTNEKSKKNANTCIAFAQERIDKYNKKLKVCQTKIVDMKNSLIKLENEINAEKEVHQKIKEEVAEKIKTNSENQKKLSELVSQIEAERDKISKLEQTTNEKGRLIESAKAEINKNENILNNLTKDEEALEKELEKQIKSADELKRELERIQEKEKELIKQKDVNLKDYFIPDFDKLEEKLNYLDDNGGDLLFFVDEENIKRTKDISRSDFHESEKEYIKSFRILAESVPEVVEDRKTKMLNDFKAKFKTTVVEPFWNIMNSLKPQEYDLKNKDSYIAKQLKQIDTFIENGSLDTSKLEQDFTKILKDNYAGITRNIVCVNQGKWQKDHRNAIYRLITEKKVKDGKVRLEDFSLNHFEEQYNIDNKNKPEPLPMSDILVLSTTLQSAIEYRLNEKCEHNNFIDKTFYDWFKNGAERDAAAERLKAIKDYFAGVNKFCQGAYRDFKEGYNKDYKHEYKCNAIDNFYESVRADYIKNLEESIKINQKVASDTRVTLENLNKKISELENRSNILKEQKEQISEGIRNQRTLIDDKQKEMNELKEKIDSINVTVAKNEKTLNENTDILKREASELLNEEQACVTKENELNQRYEEELKKVSQTEALEEELKKKIEKEKELIKTQNGYIGYYDEEIGKLKKELETAEEGLKKTKEALIQKKLRSTSYQTAVQLSSDVNYMLRAEKNDYNLFGEEQLKNISDLLEAFRNRNDKKWYSKDNEGFIDCVESCKDLKDALNKKMLSPQKKCEAFEKLEKNLKNYIIGSVRSGKKQSISEAVANMSKEQDEYINGLKRFKMTNEGKNRVEAAGKILYAINNMKKAIKARALEIPENCNGKYIRYMNGIGELQKFADAVKEDEKQNVDIASKVSSPNEKIKKENVLAMA